jgi:DNA (cytosine-5)-methyltransferase 1
MNDPQFTAATCFSGIGAPELGGAGLFDFKWCAEIEPTPAAILAARFGASSPVFMPSPEDPDLDEKTRKERLAAIKAVSDIKGGNGPRNLGDVSNDKFIEEALSLGDIDLLVGGPPCQAFSFAGLRQSLLDDRGNLSLRFVEIAHAIRPRILLVENVPGWLSTPDNAFGCFLGAIVGGNAPLPNPSGRKWANSGMVSGPKARVAWRILNAKHFGVAQRRRRVFVVVSFGKDDPARILFERKRVFGNITSSGKARETREVAGTFTARARGGGGLGTDFELSGGLQPVAARMTAFGEYSIDETASTVKARDWKDATDLVINEPPPLAATLRGEEISPTLRGMNNANSRPNGGGQSGVAYDLRGREGGVEFEGPHETANIRAASGGSSKSYILEGATNFAVRRLTPTECERLQGFPDGFTAIDSPRSRKVSPVMADYLSASGLPVDDGKTSLIADGARYKSLGNSWAVPCGQWIINRIYLEMKGEL